MPAADAAAPIDAAEAAQLLAPLDDLGRAVLAVSGGPDSTALLVLAAERKAAARRFPDLLAVTVDHGLRAAAAAEAAAVALLAARLGVPHRIVRWDGEKPATGLPAAARAARYDLLARQAAAFGAADIVLAHTRDDQGETVLLRLAAGSGPAGLAAMRACEVRGKVRLRRPFLAVAKARLAATLAVRGISWSEDPSNADPAYARPRLRAAQAALAREGLSAERLSRLAGRLARAEAALEAATDEAAGRLVEAAGDASRVRFDAAGFRALPGEIGLRLLGRAVEAVGTEGPVELGKLERLHAELLAAPGLCRRTLAGALVAAGGATITVAPAPPRRR